MVNKPLFLTAATMALGALMAAGCASSLGTGGEEQFDPSAFAGSWAGTWQTLDGARQGPATIVVTIDPANGTFTVTLDLNGEVFPDTDPEPVGLSGSYNEDGATGSAEDTSLGNLQMSVNSRGRITGVCSRLPHPAVRRIHFSGGIERERLGISFVAIAADNSLVSGYLSLSK